MRVLRPVRPRLVLVALALLFGVLIWRFGHVGLVPAFAISFCAVFVNGLLLTLEDDMPGGFNNPDGSSTPRYVRVLTRITRGALALVCLLLAVLLFVSASGVGFTTARGVALACFGLVPICAYLAVRTQRRAALAALIAAIGMGLLLAWIGRGF
jgi:hypothetical protein